MVEGERTLAVEPLDRLNRGLTLVSLLGPLELPSRDQFVEALHRVAVLGPQARVGLQFGSRRGTWRYRANDLAAWCDSLVTTTDQAPGDLVETTMAGLSGPSDVPLRFVLAGDHILTVFDHAIGDGPLMELLPAAIIEMARGDDIPEIFGRARVRGGLVAALRETYLRRPLALSRAIRARADYQRSRRATPPSTTTPTVPIPSYYYARATQQQLRELKTLTRSTPTPVSLTSLLLALLRRSLEAQGLTVALEASLVVDARRYLPRGDTALGNLITGMPIRLGDSDETVSIDTQTTKMLDSSWPLATLALGALRAGRPAPSSGASPSALRLSLSSPGMLRRTSGLPWLTSRERIAIYAVSPVAEGQLSVSAMVVGAELHITASFSASSIDAAAVQRAIDQVTHDPASLLDDSA